MIMILIMRGGISGGEGVRKQIRSRPRPSLTLCALLWIISYFVCNAMMIHYHSRKLKAKVRTLGTKNVINRNIRTTQSPKRYGVQLEHHVTNTCYQFYIPSTKSWRSQCKISTFLNIHCVLNLRKFRFSQMRLLSFEAFTNYLRVPVFVILETLNAMEWIDP